MNLIEKIEKANQETVDIIDRAQPVLVDMKYARDVLEGLDKYTILHAGPPLKWEEMSGPMQGAIVGVIRYEGLAETEEEAWKVATSGKVKFGANHAYGAVGPMTGMISSSMPLFEVVNETYGNKAYVAVNEGLGKVMRFGANDDEVLERLSWLEKDFAPIMKKALELSGGINLKVMASKALAMGDEMHQRNVAASSLFAREIMPHIIRTTSDASKLERIVDFIVGNEQFFLNLAMAMGKATADPAKNIEYSTIVTTMARNGNKFGIKVSSLGEEWFEAPVNMPVGLYFPGFTEEDSNPDMGDSAIVEVYGLGGFAMAAAPAVVRFVGAGSTQDALNYTNDMYQICQGRSSLYIMPTMDFQGVPTGIDIRKVADTGILPVINTGVAHKEPGIGQVGAGIVTAPMDCFIKAIKAYGDKYGL